MIEETIKYSCDYCEADMTQGEYESGVDLTITVHLPHPEGKCGQVSEISMRICEKCSTELGIVNSKEYHNFMYSATRLKNKIIEIKNKIIEFCFRKINKEDKQNANE